ncbi:MAG TPA: hypothetical protein VHB73_00780 [Alphaproteobacteria bacterium]|nr:hypothetical protein [Alphaproteobacteria bacterium]
MQPQDQSFAREARALFEGGPLRVLVGASPYDFWGTGIFLGPSEALITRNVLAEGHVYVRSKPFRAELWKRPSGRGQYQLYVWPEVPAGELFKRDPLRDPKKDYAELFGERYISRVFALSFNRAEDLRQGEFPLLIRRLRSMVDEVEGRSFPGVFEILTTPAFTPCTRPSDERVFDWPPLIPTR